MKKIFLFISLLFAVSNLMAEPIGERRAREIATDFLSQYMTRSSVCDLDLAWAGNGINNTTRSGSNIDDSLMYIYNSEASNSFVIVGGDTNAEFVIAYSLDNTIDMDNLSDAAKTILDAWCLQIDDARQSGKPINIATCQSTRANDKLEYKTALWDQSEPYNREAPIIDNERSLTGCAATAMSIICHYNKWPERGVGTTPAYAYVDDSDHRHQIPSNTLGRTYEYDKMLYDYSNGYTESQANAVAAIMKDMGTAIKMKYHPDGSGTSDANALSAFKTYFGYTKNAEILNAVNYSYDEWTSILKENLRNYGPTFYAGHSYTGGGHAFVVDGFDENSRIRINYGWSGTNNGYYYLPSSEYYKYQSAILYLKPDTDGTSQYHDKDYLALYSDDEYQMYGVYSLENSYSKGTPFTCWLGLIGNLGTNTFTGELKLVLCDKDSSWKQVLWSESTTIESNYFDYIYFPQCTITKTINEGDRIRLYYKGTYSDEWKWAQSRYADMTVDEIIVKASPDEVAKNLSFDYDEDEKILSLKSKQAVKIRIFDNSTGKEIYSPENLIQLQTIRYHIESGRTYRIECSSGSNPYKLILKL